MTHNHTCPGCAKIFTCSATDCDSDDPCYECLRAELANERTQNNILIEQMEFVVRQRDKLKKALFDVCDGNDWHDIKHFTGLSDERCMEIIALAREGEA